ncbi:hypothetical protein NL676_034955 [Syzygium grande]|nr:hypothetical protein NL676_034955 [Syzygium grande]
MNSKAFASLFFAVFVFSSSAASAFNITRLLSQYPEFSTFNEFLNQAKLYEQINHRQTITVLAVDNSAIGSISGKPLDVLKRILSSHVVLDYYDVDKLQDLSKKSTLLTTLYQTSGTAVNQQGFLNVTKLNGGDIVFGSAVKGADLDAKLVKAVAAQPYNISVLQVSSPIIAPGIDKANATTPSTSPAATPKKAPTSSPAKAPVVAETPDSSEAPAAEEPAADAPADAPEADTPASSPPAPASDADADAPAPAKSSSSRVASHVAVGIVMGLLSAVVA